MLSIKRHQVIYLRLHGCQYNRNVSSMAYQVRVRAYLLWSWVAQDPRLRRQDGLAEIA